MWVSCEAIASNYGQQILTCQPLRLRMLHQLGLTLPKDWIAMKLVCVCVGGGGGGKESNIIIS